MERSRHALMECFLDMEGDTQAEVKLLRLICEVLQDQDHALEYVKGRLAVLEAAVRNLKGVSRG